jgi:pimeloyl-ACP methyl ester carboxylesterase
MKLIRIFGIILGSILLLLFFVPLLIPVPPPENVVPIEQLVDPDSQFIDVNGLQIHYKTAGKGQPVIILLHGFGASVFSWREVIEPLSGLGTVIAYDRPAFGLSGRPMRGEWHGDNPYSMTYQDDILIGLMKALEIERAILVGNSLGGTVSVYTALEHPERVLGLALVDASIYTNNATPLWRRILYKTPQMDHLGPLIVRSIASTGDDSIRQAWHNPDLLTIEIFEGYHKPLLTENWDRALWEFTRAGDRPDLASRLPELTIPILVLTGDDDRVVSTERSLQLASEIPHANLVVFETCGHLPQEECPDQFLSTLRNFIKQLKE